MIHQAFEEGLFVDLSIIIVLHCIISFLFEFGGETYYSKIKLSQFHQQFKRNGKYIALNVKFQSWKTEIVLFCKILSNNFVAFTCYALKMIYENV